MKEKFIMIFGIVYRIVIKKGLPNLKYHLEHLITIGLKHYHLKKKRNTKNYKERLKNVQKHVKILKNNK
jgi:hypothetical protein